MKKFVSWMKEHKRDIMLIGAGVIGCAAGVYGLKHVIYKPDAFSHNIEVYEDGNKKGMIGIWIGATNRFTGAKIPLHETILWGLDNAKNIRDNLDEAIKLSEQNN